MAGENSQLGRAPASLVAEDYVLQTARGDSDSVQRAVQRKRVRGEIPVPPQDFCTILKTSFIDSRIAGVIKDTMHGITSRNTAIMLSKNIDGQLMNMSTL